MFTIFWEDNGSGGGKKNMAQHGQFDWNTRMISMSPIPQELSHANPARRLSFHPWNLYTSVLPSSNLMFFRWSHYCLSIQLLFLFLLWQRQEVTYCQVTFKKQQFGWKWKQKRCLAAVVEVGGLSGNDVLWNIRSGIKICWKMKEIKNKKAIH